MSRLPAHWMSNWLVVLLMFSIPTHAIIWFSNSFIAGRYPWLASWVLDENQRIYPAAMSALVFWCAFLIFGLRGWVARYPTHPLTLFARNPRRWYNAFIITCTTSPGIGLIIPLVLLLAGPLSPAVLEATNLFSVYLLGLLIMPRRFTPRQIGVQLLWLLAMVAGAIAFIMLMNGLRTGNWQGHAMLAALGNPQLVLAVGLSLAIHMVLWFTSFYAMGYFPWLQKRVFSNAGDNASFPRVWVGVLMLGCLAGYAWLTYGHGVEGLLPQQVTQHVTSQGYLARWQVYLLGCSVMLATLFPLLIHFAGTNRPVVICLGNIMVLVGITVLDDPAPFLNWQSAGVLLGAFAALALTALGFVKVQQNHEAQLSA